jgi:hypothetical protein
MEKDTFTMDYVEAIALETPPDDSSPEPAASDKQADDPQADTKPEPTSFLEAFQKAKAGEDLAEPKQPDPDSDSDSDSDSKESRSASDFKLIKAERDDANTKMTKLENQLKELENKDVDDLLKQVQAERDDLSERLKISSIERHPEFQQRFDAKIEQVIKNAQTTVGEHNADNIERLLKMEDSDLRTDGIELIFAELSPSKQAKLGAMLAQVDDIGSERKAMLANAEESYHLLAASADNQREQHLAASNKVFDDVVSEAKNLEIYQPREGEDEWNQQVDGRIQQARNIFTGDSDAQELARASLWAAAGPAYRELLRSQVELNRRLQAQIKGESGANPTVSTGSEKPAEGEPKSFMEVFSEVTGMDVSS